MLKALIVDDEPISRDELAYLLRRTGLVEVVGEADRLDRALALVRETEPDVVFLDIQLEGESGMDMARTIRDQGGEAKPEIVFATAYDEYALQAFELNASDYVLKPFEESRIKRAVEKVAKLIERRGADAATAVRRPKQPERPERLPVSVDDRIMLIPADRIVYVGFEDGKTVIATDDRDYRVNEPLTTLERRLEHGSFFRVHRAYVVNLDAVVEIQPWFHSTCNLIMRNGASVPVSRTYLKELKQLLGF
ncbi:LytR/AlgR family response regulator transcription factor [Paenibacillus flagellatus]|uniref:DNA-binding response regulator n=1 Tax=Paenibacillus flagellatus TaxID=2211139 RepID=A0A2V5KQ60_9BACL|nr:LytTR family transcriptional regulator DNA-binding domain-containing protein [Paenibacillus flagellatus]PYI50746.1 DNA-binding response regulator [Paenibacillus flagellatus]